MDELMQQCPHWEGCNAPICPLSLAGSHIASEPVCRLAREVVKIGGEAHVAGYVPEGVYAGLISGLPRLRGIPDIARSLARAAASPIKTGNPLSLPGFRGTAAAPPCRAASKPIDGDKP